MLDLTDNEEIQYIEKIWKRLDLKPELNQKKKKMTKLGDKLNFLFDYISEFSENYRYNNIFFENEKIRNVKPWTSSNVIYNVKTIECIKNKGRVIENE